MKERLLKLTSSPLAKLWLLVVFVMTCVSASAEVEWKTFETETTYKFDTKVKTYYKYTPTEDGIFYIYYSAAKPSICSAADDNGPLTGYEDTDGSWISYTVDKFSWYRKEYNGTYYSSQVEASVKANTTYYISIPDSWSGGTFIGHLEGSVTEMKLVEQNFESDKTFNVTDNRYGQLELTFNVAATADQWAYLKVGNYPTDANKEDGKIETRMGSNTGSLIFNLKDSINSWMDKGYFKEGDDVTLTITGIHAKTDESIIYGTDGTLVLTFKAPGKAHNLVSYYMPDPFYSYWQKGDKAGIATMTFDYDVMQGDEQTCKVGLVIGSGDAGDAYQETLDVTSGKIYAEGKTLYIDLTDKLRTYAAMGLKQQYESFAIKIFNVLLADGTNPYSSGNGKSGSYSYTVSFEEKNYSNQKPDFTPESGEKLTEDLKIYFADKNAFTFTGVKFTYQDQSDRNQQEIVTEGITSEAVGKNGIEYTIPVSDAMKAGKNIRLSFVGLVSADGIDHSDLCDGIKFNPGDELIADLTPAKVSIKNGAVIDNFEKLELTFDEELAINKPAGREQVLFTDATSGKSIEATIAVDENDAKKVIVTPATELKNTHSFNITINEAVIVNKQYAETSGKYGRYMTEQSYNFSLNKNKGVLDFVVTPVEGSIVNEISTITCKTDQSKPSSTHALSYSHSTEPSVYVKLINEKGDSIARAQIADCEDNDGFTLTFEPAITEPGKYTVVMTDSVYYIGEGYDATANEYEVSFEYTVIAAPEASITLTATPADESTVESLSTIILESEEPIFGGTTPITAYNRADRKSYTGKLSVSPAKSNEAIIVFDEEITAKGEYTVDIPAGVVGDQTWYDNDYQTGKCNEYMVLYYTIGDATPAGDLFTTDPEANSTVTSLQHIVISVGDGKSDYSEGNGKVTITGPDNTVLFSGDPDAIWPEDWNDPAYQFEINLAEEATAEGVYTMTIPDGYFLDADGNEVAGTTITWTIGGDAPTPKSLFTTDPEANSTVTSLKHIVISVGDGKSDYSEGNGKVTITGPDNTVLFSGDPDAIWPEDWNDPAYQFEINLAEEATAAGVYTMTIPDGYFVDSNYEEVAGAVITWTVSSASGINRISADSKMENVKVYSLDGKAIKSTNGLKGAYIVNGKKVILK